MRTLHADLTTAQQQDSATPYIELNFRSRSGVTTRSYKTTDATNRIQLVQQAEGRYGGTIAVPGSQDIAAIIQLRDADNSLIGLDWKGYRLDIAWGYNTDSGNRAVAVSGDNDANGEGEPLYVVRQRSVSVEGELYLELDCASLWGILNRLWLNRTSQIPIKYKIDTSNEAEMIEIMHELLGGSTVNTPTTSDTGTVVTFDAGAATYTAYDIESRNRFENNVELVPLDSSAVGDITYFASVDKFNRLSMNLTTPGAGGWTITWEYWNGAWVSISPAPTGNVTFQVGQLVITVLGDGHLADWATTNLNGTDVVFPDAALYYVRARVAAQTVFTTAPLATYITLAMDFASEMDTSDEDEIGVKPTYESSLDELLITTLKAVQSRVRLRTVLRKDGFHTRFIDKNQAGQDYIYSLSGDHTFFSSTLESGPIIPNEVLVINKDPGEPGSHEGSANDGISIAALGHIIWVKKEESSVDTAEDITIAQAIIDSLIWDSHSGDIEVPMNVGQEIWDKIQVIDSRSGETYTGFVSGLERLYKPGVYKLRIQMGGNDRIAQPNWLLQAQRHVIPAQDIERRRIEIQTASSSPLPIDTNLETGIGVFPNVNLSAIPTIPTSVTRPTFRDLIPTSAATPVTPIIPTPIPPRLPTPPPRGGRVGGVMQFPLSLLDIPVYSPDEARWANPTIPDILIPKVFKTPASPHPEATKNVQNLILKSADQTVNNSTSFIDDNDLLFEVGRNEIWIVEYTLFHRSDNTPEIKFLIDLPSGATFVQGGHRTTAGAGSHIGDIDTDSNTSGGIVCSGSTGQDMMTLFNGVITISTTGGECKLQWAQWVADMSNTIVRKNSYIKAFRVS